MRDLAFLFGGAYIGFLAGSWSTLGRATYRVVERIYRRYSGNPLG